MEGHEANSPSPIPRPDAPARGNQAGRLTSWKEIASYLNTSVRSVQRWEKTEALPVRRHEHERAGRVFAVKDDLDAWLRSRTSLPEPEPPEPDAAIIPERAHSAKRAWMAAIALVLCCVAAMALYGRREPPSYYDRITPLNTAIGLKASPDFSPDGTRVVFTLVPTGDLDRTDLYETALDGTGTPRRLTSASGDEYSPAWSPDGKRIAFLRNTALMMLDLASATETVLSRELNCNLIDGRNCVVAWMPGGRTLLILERGSAGSNRIFEFDLETRKRRLALGLEVSNERAFALSPDRRRLAHIRRQTEKQYRICLLELESARDDCFTAPVQVEGIGWMPDARELLVSGRRDQEGGLWRIGLDGSRELRRVVSAGSGTIAAFRISPVPDVRGAVDVVYEENPADTQVQQMSLEEPGVWRGLTPPSASRGHRQIDPQFSPDGEWLAFAMGNSSGTQEIWVCRGRDGSALRRISDAGGDPGSPHCSPDGRFLAYDRMDLVTRDIYVAEVATAVSRRLSSPISDDVRPSWSHDGRWIYFSSNRLGKSQIWKIHPDGAGATPVTEGIGFEPLESANGSEVYFLRSFTEPGLWSVPVTGGPERLVHAGVWPGLYAVSNAGILFAELKDAGVGRVQRLVMLNPATGHTRVLDDRGWLTETGTPALTISPDGKWVAAVRFALAVDLKVIHGLR